MFRFICIAMILAAGSAAAQDSTVVIDLSVEAAKAINASPIRPVKPENDAICRRAFYDIPPDVFDAVGQEPAAYDAEWCTCMVSEFEPTGVQVKHSQIPRDEGYFDHLITAMKEIAVMREENSLDTPEAFQRISTQKFISGDGFGAAVMDELDRRVTLVFHDLSVDGICNFPK